MGDLKTSWRQQAAGQGRLPDGSGEGPAGSMASEGIAARLGTAVEEVRALVRRSSVGVELPRGAVSAALLQMQSPVSAGRTWTVLTARDGRGLQDAARRLVAESWPRLEGAGAILPVSGSARMIDAARPYYQWHSLGILESGQTMLRAWARQNILMWVGGVFALIAAFALALRVVVVRARRHAGVGLNAPGGAS